MIRFSLFALIHCLALTALIQADDPKPEPKATPEEIVTKGIRDFHERMRSGNAAIRDKAFDEVMMDKKLLARLFGTDAEIVWPKIEETIPKMRAAGEKGKEELDKRGAIDSITLHDLRKDDFIGRFKSLSGVIPKDIPAYRATIRYANATASASTYLVVDGRMRYVPGLETIPEMIQKEKAAPDK